MSLPDEQTTDAAFRRDLIATLPRLRRFCASLAGSIDAGDDLLQATVERALSRAAQWQAGTRLDSWLFRIAQNMAIDLARSRKTRGQQVDVETLASHVGDDGRDIVEYRSALAATHAAMAALPGEQRAVIALIVMDGRSYREAADILAIPVGSVMSRLSRARSSLAATLSGDSGERKKS